MHETRINNKKAAIKAENETQKHSKQRGARLEKARESARGAIFAGERAKISAGKARIGIIGMTKTRENSTGNTAKRWEEPPQQRKKVRNFQEKLRKRVPKRNSVIKTGTEAR